MLRVPSSICECSWRNVWAELQPRGATTSLFEFNFLTGGADNFCDVKCHCDCDGDGDGDYEHAYNCDCDCLCNCNCDYEFDCTYADQRCLVCCNEPLPDPSACMGRRTPVRARGRYC
jgi:hypothetical protein